MRIDPRTREITARIPADVRQGDCNCPPGGLVIAEGGLYAADQGKGRVVRYDVTTGQEERPFEMGPGFEGYFTIGGGMLWAVENPEPRDLKESYLVRIDLSSGTRKRFPLGGDSYFSGVTYGEGAVWIADEAKTVIRVDPETHETTRATIPTGVIGDDIAIAPGAVIVWEPDNGHLTRVDSKTVKPAGAQTPRGYRTGKTVNWISSDLAIANGSAWVTEPAAGVVHELEF
jgi:outer membrane protein assembly factor BamB